MAAGAGSPGPRGAGHERVRLRDQTEVLVRPLEPEDRDLDVDAFGHLGEASRYQRFLAYKKELSERDLDLLTDVDHDRHEALVAIDPAPAGPSASRG